ncbi:hypothetical protein ACJBU6_04686 [Exserohilum turcicum]
MITNLLFLSFALLTTASTTETFKSRTLHPELNAALRTAATAFDRAALLPRAADWTYDFTQHPNYNSATGAVITADAATFPAVTGLGSSVALLKLAPCGMLPPHLHPRATNMVTAITGNTTTYMIGENGVGVRIVTLLPLMVTVFPQASLHMMQNNGMFLYSCSPPPSLIFCLSFLGWRLLRFTHLCASLPSLPFFLPSLGLLTLPSTSTPTSTPQLTPPSFPNPQTANPLSSSPRSTPTTAAH